MGKSQKKQWGQKLRAPVLLFMMGGTAIGTTGCATTSDFVSRNWQRLRGEETTVAEVESSPKTGPATASLGDPVAKGKMAEKTAKKGDEVALGAPAPTRKSKLATSSDLVQLGDEEPAPTATTPKARKNYFSLFQKEKNETATDPFITSSEESAETPPATSETEKKPLVAETNPQAQKKEVEKPAASEELSFEVLLAQVASSSTTTAESAPETPIAEEIPAEETESEREARLQALFAEMSGEPASTVAEGPVEENPFALEANSEDVKTAAIDTAITEEAAPAAPEEAVISDARLQADTLLLRARIALRRDHADDALRLALAAEKIEKDAKLTYGKQEERPSDFVNRLQRRQTAEVDADTGAVTAETRQSEPQDENITPPETRPSSVIKVIPPSTPGVWTAIDSAQRGTTDDAQPVAQTAVEGGKSVIETARFEATAKTGRVLANQPAQVPLVSANPETEAETTTDAPSLFASHGEALQKLTPEAQAEAKAAASENAAKHEARVEAAEPEVTTNTSSEIAPIEETPYPWKLVIAFVCGGLGLLGFGLWRRMQLDHFTPRS